ncbi:D-alanyl-D-alanine dipeptidase [Elusimicrobium posterum]|uniref:D-alanyl-D-alanine dipeptidase n=1 Tax=Elusimicrobium posterum TaxID=3116653 RepID=UPI003C781626
MNIKSQHFLFFIFCFFLSPLSACFAQADVEKIETQNPHVSSPNTQISSAAALAQARFVNIQALAAPTLFFDIRYAKDTNFTGKIIYTKEECYLRKEATAGLMQAYAAAQKLNPKLTFLIYDCYRPASAQYKLWEVLPDARYVAPPQKGSRHSRGMAVDLTLATMDGTPLEMPSGYDTFTKKSHMNYEGKDISEEAIKNRELLKKLMTDAGFTYTRTEWWHFDYPGWQEMPLENIDF